MKYSKILYPCLCLIASLSLVACEQDVVYDIDYVVVLDKDNTYIAGEPVRFNIEGNVDNIVFYSGEEGAKYSRRNVYDVPIESVLSAELSLDFQARYGTPGALDVYISKENNGLYGFDWEVDRKTITDMVSGGMPGWVDFEYQEGASTKWTNQVLDVTDFKDNFCIAFHWHPADYMTTQRTYWVNGTLTMELNPDLAGKSKSIIDFSDLDFVTVMMNEKVENPYINNNGDGSIVFTDSYDINFKGIAGYKEATETDKGAGLPYAIDAWAISRPISLNKVANDKGTVIKNLQNYLHSFEYTWDEPGSYTVTFVGTNANYAATSQKVCEMTVNILAPPFDAE